MESHRVAGGEFVDERDLRAAAVYVDLALRALEGEARKAVEATVTDNVWIAVARTLARPRMDQMRASKTFSYDLRGRSLDSEMADLQTALAFVDDTAIPLTNQQRMRATTVPTGPYWPTLPVN